jgi:hypothetical protein
MEKGGDAEARLAMLELANMISIPMVLTAVIRLEQCGPPGPSVPILMVLTAVIRLEQGRPDPASPWRSPPLEQSGPPGPQRPHPHGAHRRHSAGAVWATQTQRPASSSPKPRSTSRQWVGHTLVPGPSGTSSYADYTTCCSRSTRPRRHPLRGQGQRARPTWSCSGP